MIDRCDRCKYFQAVPTELGIPTQGAGVGYCYRFPPTAAQQPTPKGLATISLHPPVQADHFCGEFTKQLVLIARSPS